MTETDAHLVSAAGSRRSGWSAEELLGPDHPLARAEERARWLGRQAVTLAAVLPAEGAALLAGWPGLSAALLATVVVEVALLVALAGARSTRREQAIAVVAAGRETLPVASVRREAARLGSARRILQLARTIESLRCEARSPYRRRPAGRPLYIPAVVREVDAELAGVAHLLRSGHPGATALARVELVLGGTSSPLYGDDVPRLREELARIRFAAAVP